jgi:bacteriorhodopsin
MPRSEIKWAIYLVGLGMALVVYAHAQFATKDEVKEVKVSVRTMEGRIYDLWAKSFPDKAREEKQ